jgi:hypothetical protein
MTGDAAMLALRRKGVRKQKYQRGSYKRMARIGEPGGDRSVDQLAERIAEIEARLAVPPDLVAGFEFSDQALATVAARVYRARRRRERHFDAAIFADPAWDMLLDLFIAKTRGKAIRTSSLCIAGAVPVTTGLRWIAELERRGLIERHKAPGDRRVKLVALSEQGHRMMRQYLAEGVEASELPTSGGFA